MRYLSITPSLCLVEQEIPQKATSVRPDTLNHLWLYDRSGSMCGLLSRLADDLIVRAKELPVGDTISLGWFSGQGQFNFILKGFRITDQKDYTILERTINQNKTTIGCTCFSEILHDTEKVVSDLSVISPNFALCFFTDGYPVVSNYSREIESIQDAIKKLNGKIGASLLVGYGDYYNKDLMSDMAERLGGALCHSSDLPSFDVSLTDFISGARDGGDRIVVEIETKNPQIVFGVNGKMVNIFSLDSNNEVRVTASKKGKDVVFALAKTPPHGAKEVKLTDKTAKSSDSLVRGAYAAAYALTQRTKTDLALEVLGAIGDKEMIDRVTNSFTPAEYGVAEAAIQTAMASPSKRFAKGRDTDYLPPADAFCLLDALDVLLSDRKAFFYPYNDGFVYRRVGRSAETQPGYPQFQANDDVRCAISSLTWNSSRLNLSVLANILGKIDLQAKPVVEGGEVVTPASVGLADVYPTYVWRNYTLVRDGFLNVQNLPVSMSQKSFSILQNAGMIVGAWGDEQTVHILDLSAIPVVNRKIAEGRTSASMLCRSAMKEIELKAAVKTYKWALKKDDGEETALTTFSELQRALLAANGIDKNNAFSPPSVPVKTDDYYDAKTFEIKAKGLSSIPKIDNVVAKMKDGKKLTPAETLVSRTLQLIESSTKRLEDAVRDRWLEKQVETAMLAMRTVRREIQETKFATLLGKKWFDEFSSRDENRLTVDGNEFTISLGTEQVPL